MTTSTEVERSARPLVHPATGQIVDLEADATDLVAEFVLAVDDTIAELIEIRDAARVELTRRMDLAATWTLHGQSFDAKASSPSAGSESYDAKPLRDALLDLADQGELDDTAVDNAVAVVIPEPQYKVRRAGINALLKLPNPRVHEAIAKHRHPAPPAAPAEARKAQVKRIVRSGA